MQILGPTPDPVNQKPWQGVGCRSRRGQLGCKRPPGGSDEPLIHLGLLEIPWTCVQEYVSGGSAAFLKPPALWHLPACVHESMCFNHKLPGACQVAYRTYPV